MEVSLSRDLSGPNARPLIAKVLLLLVRGVADKLASGGCSAHHRRLLQL